MCVYSARLLTEKDVYWSELRLMLQWVMVIVTEGVFCYALGRVGEAFKNFHGSFSSFCIGHTIKDGKKLWEF